MKKLLKRALVCAALFLFLVPAGAQSVIYVAATKENGNIVVLNNIGDVTYEYAGLEVVGLGANPQGVWTLVRTTDVEGKWFDGRTDKHMPGWGEYVLYHNGEVYKRYPYGDPETCCISSAALKVTYDQVVVAGTYAKRWKNTNYYYGKMWGEINGRRIYGDPESDEGWERMSLKRKWFQGFAEPSRGLFNIGYAKTPDVDGNFTSMYHVYACDAMDGKIYTVGWGEREYTYYNVGNAADAYYVRRCARGWINGKEALKQVPNQTSGARALTMGGTSENPIWYTAGHHRGKPMHWNNSTEASIPLDVSGVITSEAVVFFNDTARRYFILNGRLYKNDSSAGRRIVCLLDRPINIDIVACYRYVYVLRTWQGPGGYKFSVHVIDTEEFKDKDEVWNEEDFRFDGVTMAWKVAVW